MISYVENKINICILKKCYESTFYYLYNDAYYVLLVTTVKKLYAYGDVQFLHMVLVIETSENKVAGPTYKPLVETTLYWRLSQKKPLVKIVHFYRRFSKKH